jgi:cobalt/nickel transport system ATP-binding protein
MNPTTIISLVHVSYAYPGAGNPILNHADISLSSSQRIGLIGPNGCGKTTLFHVMMGLIKPQSGSVFYRGKELREEKDFRDLRADTGLLFQDADDQLFSPTVLEDVSFGPLNMGARPGEALDRARETLAGLGLPHLESRITHQLSGGEKKLVALATILAMQPSALLLDEPTNNLDPETQARLIEIVTDLDLAHIIISHDYDFLLKTCQDLYLFDKGHLLRSDTSHIHTHHHAHPHGAQPHEHGDN